MIDEDLRQLNAHALDHSLDALESDIWAGLEMRNRRRAVARSQVSFQGAVLALSLVASLAIGFHATRASDHSPLLLASGLELAPSSLLFGRAR